jgi:predicted secreted Zn-dependent protease
VLRHEQKHFDIVELYARKLRKLINANNYSSAIELTIKSDSLYAIIDKEMDVYQDKYDDETDGSMNGEQQRAWEKKITNEISELEAYKNKSSIIYLQNKSH